MDAGDLPYRDEDHGEYEVLAEERYHQRGRWYDLDDQQEEHVETDENRNGKRHLQHTCANIRKCMNFKRA